MQVKDFSKIFEKMVKWEGIYEVREKRKEKDKGFENDSKIKKICPRFKLDKKYSNYDDLFNEQVTSKEAWHYHEFFG